MGSYRYHIITAAGNRKRGVIQAGDWARALDLLTSQGSTVISLNQAGILDREIHLSLTRKVPPRDMSVFCLQFAAIMRAGVSLTRALEILTKQTENKVLQEALYSVWRSVEKGEPLSESMRSCNHVFSDLFVNLIQAGEESGRLELPLKRMAIYYEKTVKIRSMMQKAMIYPVILMIVSLVVLIVMMIYIVPMYSEMFAQMDMELPAYTRAVVWLSNGMVHYWYLILGGIVVSLLFCRWGLKTETGKYFYSLGMLKIPVLGRANTKNICARMSRNLSSLVTAGVPVIQALKIVTDTMGNKVFKKAMIYCTHQVEEGQPLSRSLRETGVFPAMVHHMVGIGEETGELDHMLDHVASYYEEEVELETQKIAAFMEPLIIIVMALMVLGVIGAVYAPMLSMYQNAGNF